MLQQVAGRVSNWFGADHLSEKTKFLLLRYLSYASLVRAFLALSSTFLILYVLDLVGFALAGVLVATNLFVQAIFDYPTGILSDWLGQRFVLILSYSSFGISFLLFALSNSYTILLIAYVFYAFATAQESGTLISWFDNNYKFIATRDSDRSTYKSITGKTRVIVDLFGGIFLLMGGWIATQYSRTLVFQIQVFAMLVIILATFLLIYDFDGFERQSDPDAKYLQLLRDGVTSILQSKLVTLLVLASVFFQVQMGVFGALMLFPVYFGYTGTDFGAAIFRFSLFIAGSLALWLIADWVAELKTRSWLPRIHLVHSVLFGVGFVFMFYTTPITNNFNLKGIIIAWVLIFVTHMMRVSVNIFLRRIYLDVIPDHRRNGFYSFTPTITLLASAPFVLGSGEIIATQGFVDTTTLLAFIGIISSIFFYIAMRYLPDTFSVDI